MGVRKQLPRISAPTQVVTSEHDAVVPPPYGRHWQHAISGATLTTLPGVGHLATLEAPEVCAQLARDFFRAEAQGIAR